MSKRPKKPKCVTCSTGWCKNHLFELNPLFGNLYHRKIFKSRLCPRQNKHTGKFQKIIPLFNKDHKFYTPSFILEEEKKYYEDNDERVRNNHLRKLEDEMPDSNETIYEPKQTRKRNYCFACKADYVDYLEHIKDLGHKKNLRNNRFTPFILEAQELFRQQLAAEQELKKQEEIKKFNPLVEETCSMSIEQSPKCFGFIQKLSRPSENIALQGQPEQKEQQIQEN